MSSLSVEETYKIREQHYEKTKNLTPKELSESIKKDIEEHLIKAEDDIRNGKVKDAREVF